MDSSRFCGKQSAATTDAHQLNKEETEMDATTIGVDLAKSVFEVAVANAQGRVVARHRFTRPQFERFLRDQPPAHVVMETCGTAHFWGRVAQTRGHRVSLLPAQYVRPYVQRNKTDRTDAEAVLEAVRSGRIMPVPVKTVVQQELLALHRVRDQWMATRTARINALRGFLQEHGLTLPRGARTVLAKIAALLADDQAPIPGRLRQMLPLLVEEVREIEDRIARIEGALQAVAKDDAVIQRLMRIPGVGLLTATAVVATVGHIHAFRRARQFACWLGLTPSERSSGTHRRLGTISKQGDVYLRCLLTHGARSVLLAAHRAAKGGKSLSRLQQWALVVQAHRGHNKATVALANKLARIIWAVWSRDVEFLAAPAVPVAA
jgi:transposase